MILRRGIRVLPRETIPVISIDGFNDHVEVAASLVSTLATLPWDYRVFVRGPQDLSAGTSTNAFSVPITDRFELHSSENLRSQYSFHSEHDGLDEWVWQTSLARQDRRFAKRQFYFMYRYTGYMATHASGKAADELQYEMRAFYGACIAHNIMFPWGYHPDSGTHLIFLSHREGYALEHGGYLESDLRAATYYYAKGHANRKFRSQSSILNVLNPAIAMFNCSTAQRLKTAAVWIFRAASSENLMDRVLESTIALEVLLGDRKVSDKLGLTRLMSNRCAYALGNSQDNRDEIQTFFEKFYNLRSDIVHTGRLYLDENEQSLVERGLQLANEMLRFEQRLACL